MKAPSRSTTSKALPWLLAGAGLVFVSGSWAQASAPAAVARPAVAKASGSKPATAAAQGGPDWNSLSAAQRQVLAPLQPDWRDIEPSRKAKWLEVAARFGSMSAEDQQRVQQRMAEWARLTPAERGRARLSFQETKQFSPEQKQARWDAYQALPEDERKALVQRAKRATERPATAASAPITVAQPKQTVVASSTASAPLSKPVAPTIVQNKPGATTTLMARPSPPPAVQLQPGQPKIAAKPSDVDRITLLPRSGPQAVAPASSNLP